MAKIKLCATNKNIFSLFTFKSLQTGLFLCRPLIPADSTMILKFALFVYCTINTRQVFDNLLVRHAAINHSLKLSLDSSNC